MCCVRVGEVLSKREERGMRGFGGGSGAAID